MSRIPASLAFFSILATVACGDDTTIISTFSYTNVSASNVTNVSGGDDGEGEATAATTTGDAVTDASTSASTSALGETPGTTDPTSTTGEGATSEQVEPTTGGDSPNAPTGCAFFVEVLGRASTSQRHVTIDASACQRVSAISMGLTIFGAPTTPPIVGPTGSCITFGGIDSVAVGDPFGVIMDIPGVANPAAYQFSLLVDGLISDVVSVPNDITGSWAEEPNAPTTPMRRNFDWSWTIIQDHIPNCTL